MPTYRSPKVAPGVQPRHEPQGLLSVTGTYALAGALALNDIVEMVKLPRGAAVLDVVLTTDDLDTGGSPAIVLAVGDYGDAARFITGATIGQAGGLARAGTKAVPYVYSDDAIVTVKVTTGPATGAATGNVSLTVIYTMDP